MSNSDDDAIYGDAESGSYSDVEGSLFSDIFLFIILLFFSAIASIAELFISIGEFFANISKGRRNT